MPRARLLTTLTALVALTGAVASGQKVTLPDEVVTVLVEGPGLALTGRYTVLAEAPPGFPADFLPAGVQVKGAAASDSFTVVVAYVPTSADAAFVTDSARLSLVGWLPSGVPVSTFSLQPAGAPVTFCRAAVSVHVATVAARQGGHFLRMSVPKTEGRPCVARPVMTVADVVSLPTLTPPPGARQLGSSSGGNADRREMSTRLQTDKSAADLHDHYLRQLAAAGWTIDGKRLEDKLLTVSRLRSAQNADVTAVLMVMAWEKDDMRDVTLRVSRLQTTAPPPRMNPLPRPAP